MRSQILMIKEGLELFIETLKRGNEPCQRHDQGFVSAMLSHACSGCTACDPSCANSTVQEESNPPHRTPDWTYHKQAPISLSPR